MMRQPNADSLPVYRLYSVGTRNLSNLIRGLDAAAWPIVSMALRYVNAHGGSSSMSSRVTMTIAVNVFSQPKLGKAGRQIDLFGTEP